MDSKGTYLSYDSEKTWIRPSGIVQILDHVKELQRAGEDAINLSVGEPDFTTPAHIRDYAKQALDDGYTFYSDSAGPWELREAVAMKLQHENKTQ